MSKPNNLSKARAQLLLTHPFFATLLLRTPLHVVSGTPFPAATDGQSIMVRDDIVERATPQDLKTIMCHEISHMVLMHLTRLGPRNADLWNQACDHAINLMLSELELMTDVSCIEGSWLCDARFKGMTADKIYEILLKEQKAGGGGGDGPPQSGSGSKSSTSKSGRDRMHGDLQPPPMSPDEARAVEQRMTQNIAAAANVARMQGKLAGSLERLVGEILEPQVSWNDQLRAFMTRKVAEYDNWSRRNRRYRGRVYLPTASSDAMGEVVLIIDTSGSITQDDLRLVCSEVQAIEHQVKPERIRVIWADTKVAGEQVFEQGEFDYVELKPKGGGGTDMRVPLRHVEEFDPLFVILATDGYTPWPDSVPYPLITLCWTDVAIPDIGEVVRV